MMKRTALPFVLLAWICFMLFPGFGQAEPPLTEPEVVESEIVPSVPAEAETTAPEVPASDSEVSPSESDAPAAGPEIALPVPAEDTSQFAVELEGRKTWTVRYGFGSPIGLATTGLTPGQLTLDQTLTVDVTGTALSILTIEAHYNDTLPDSMQSVALYLDTERLDGVLGDFTFGSIPGFATYSKKMKGLQLEYLLGDAVLTAVVSKAEGISETVVFVGQSAHSNTQFSLYTESEDPAPYRASLNGLAAYPLKTLYAEEFSSVFAQFAVSSSLRSALNQYEIGYLYDAAVTEPELAVKSQNYRVLDLDEQILLLQRDPRFLIREWLKKLIDVYNSEIAPEGSTKRTYPFTAGTDYELDFLSAMIPFARIVVDDIVYPIGQAQQRRFYDLGHTGVREGSVVVQISTDGLSYDAIPSYRFPDYQIIVHNEVGVLECNFPASFYLATSRLNVAMDYTVTDGAFMLGLSMIPESERVTLNSRILVRDVDYMIDYEVGMLFMLLEIAETDILQVDYEVYSGGFGAASDYASYFYGLTLDLPVSDSLKLQANVLQLAEVAGSAADAQSARTMPNRHTIAGVQADISLDDFTGSILVGYNEDRFPFDSNERIPGFNRISAAASGGGYILFGHRGGVTVNEDGDWQSYGLESGLSSLIVQAIAFGDDIAYVGTNAGLTTVSLEGASPFDRAANWKRYSVDDGLSDPSVTALLVRDGVVWIGTKKGLVTKPDNADDPYADWVQFDAGGFETLPAITALAADEGHVYVGTQSGLYVYDEHVHSLELMSGTEGDRINDLEFADQTLYAASDRGLRGFRNGVGMGWLVLGQRVYALAYVDGTLYYGLSEGLIALSSDGSSTMASGWAITALTSTDDGLWAGTQASESYEMAIWQISSKGAKPFFETTTGISGVDSFAYSDSLASENTTTGWMTRASFRQNADGYSISGVAEVLPPAFRAIGSTRRVDNTGWTLAGDFELGRQGNLRVDHDYRLSDQTGETPSDRMANGVTLDWSFVDGPQWQAMWRHVDANEVDHIGNKNTRETTLSVSTEETFFRDSLTLTLSWERFSFASSRWDEQWQREKLSLSADWQVTSSLSTQASWSRPVRFVDDSITGSERASWDWDWSNSVGFAKLDVEYSVDWVRTLFEQKSLWSHEAIARLDGKSFQAFGWEFSPDLKLEGAFDHSQADVHGEFVLRSEIEAFRLTSTIRGHLTELGRPVSNREGELTLNAKYSGIADLDLFMTYSGSRSAAVMKNAIAPASSDTVTGRLIWAPEEGPRDELSISLRIKQTQASRQVTATIDNGFTLYLSPWLTQWLTLPEETVNEGYPIADLFLDSKAEYRGGTADPEFSFSTTARVFLAMAPRWNVSFATTYQLGHKLAIGLYNSLALELTFAIEF